jgi:hypothetical protein
MNFILSTSCSHSAFNLPQRGLVYNAVTLMWLSEAEIQVSWHGVYRRTRSGVLQEQGVRRDGFRENAPQT